MHDKSEKKSYGVRINLSTHENTNQIQIQISGKNVHTILTLALILRLFSLLHIDGSVLFDFPATTVVSINA